MMVVVPTANDVELTYGRSSADWLFSLLTLVGIALCVFWRVRGDVRHAAEVPVFGSVIPPDSPESSTSSASVAVDDDPWDPQRFEPHGIADEDRWIRPQLITTTVAPPVTEPVPLPEPPDASEPIVPFDPPVRATDDEDEPGPPADPTR
jgi:hypothetical protein